MNRDILIRTLTIALAFVALFWIADSAYGYFMFAERVRYLLFQEPLSFMDALIFNIPPHDLFVRIAFAIACLVAAVLIAHRISQLKAAELKLRVYSENLEELVDARTAELRHAQDELIGQRTLATLGRLAGGIGHELRNPLGVISNAVYYLELTGGGTPGAEEASLEQYLEIINLEVQTATRIVTDLLTFAGIGPAMQEPIPAKTLIEGSLEQQKAQADVRLTIEIPSDAPSFYVDPAQIREALARILQNAYQAMPNGGDLTIAVTPTSSSEQPRATIRINDTGVGIPTEQRGNLFEPLFTTKARGIGLGLAISKGLIEANEGTIAIESTVGVGTSVIIDLPTV